MTSRLLERAQTSGRVDDNEETIKQRLKTFSENKNAIIEYYSKENKVERVLFFWYLYRNPNSGTILTVTLYL